MLLTLSTTHKPASELGYLLHKHPDRVQSFDLSFGRARVFYTEVGEDRCTACLLVEADPVGMVRGGNLDQDFLAGQYVNDRPYAASSFLSVALGQVFASAMQGRCRDRPALADTPIPLSARIDVLSVRGGEPFLRAVFEPLGYQVEAVRHPLDERFPEWGDGPYYSVTVRRTATLAELLTHLYVLVPVFDSRKHYFVGDDEMEKLLAKGEGWLASHPARDEITRRYLRHRPGLVRMALARLVEEEDPADDDAEDEAAPPAGPATERTATLHEQRIAAVLEALRAGGARRVLDLGCGEGRLLRELLADRRFAEIVGLDVSIRSLEIARRRLKLDRLPAAQAERVRLIHGSLTYRDKRLAGFDAAAAVEVIEHLDPPRLSAFERVLFESARPQTVVLTTPNREYNAVWESLPAGRFRHGDHRFEWDRAEFRAWAEGVAARFGYAAEFAPVGPEHPDHGPPTQMAVFRREAPPAADATDP